MVNDYKEVYYNEYCKTCQFKDTDSGEDPCDDCLNNPYNLYSHKPINYKEKFGLVKENEKKENKK